MGLIVWQHGNILFYFDILRTHALYFILYFYIHYLFNLIIYYKIKQDKHHIFFQVSFDVSFLLHLAPWDKKVFILLYYISSSFGSKTLLS